jgi:acetyl-CoA C-acetyltransferase
MRSRRCRTPGRLHGTTTASPRKFAPVTGRSKRGDVVVDQDEGIRPDATPDSMARLRPAFADDGTITAGSASQLSDGACAVVVMSKSRAQALGLNWIAEFGAYGTVAGPDPSLLRHPASAIKDALHRDGSLRIGDLDLIKINEAFASVALASIHEFGVSPERVNVNGGPLPWGTPSA